jgi:uncharacterized protein YdeI (YjbR/CyaY-like superfamily)
MDVTETLYVKNRKEWRSWLVKNHASKKEIWLIYFKKHSGKTRIPYDDAVEEAICFGWIDSTVKKMDEERYCQRYTPRNHGSIWSDTNIMRLKKMLDAGLMTESGLGKVSPEVMDAARSGIIERKGSAVPKSLPMPEDLETALAKDETAQRNWAKFAPSHRKMYIYWVLDAKKPETRERRIARVLNYARENKRALI